MVSTVEASAPARPSWASFGHRPALDGIRAVAAIAVVLFHADMPGFDNGYAGVDVFFVLSGFLITSLIAREVWSRRRLDITTFYARRMRRLLPAALLVLLVTAVLYQWWASPLAVAENRFSFVAATLYFANWFFLARSQDYFAAETDPSPVLHYWSLSVEEQFYIVWPLVALALLLAVIARKHLAAPIVGIMAIGSIVILIAMTATNPNEAYFSTLARAYQLLIGAILALLVLRREMRRNAPPVNPIAAQVLAWVSGIVLLAVCTNLASGISATNVGLISSFATVGLIAGLEYSRQSALARGLATPVPRALGRWSYSIYLWHWPVIVLAATVDLLPGRWWLRVPAVLITTIVLAWLTWVFVESRAMSINLKKPHIRKRVIVVGLVAVAATAAAMPLIMRVSPATSQLIETIEQGQGDADVTEEIIAGATTGSKVLLVGDSHALFWVEAMSELATEQEWQFMSVTQGGCPWPFIDSYANDGSKINECTAKLREPALAAAAEFQPDITILISRAILVRDVDIDGEVVPPEGPVWAADVDRGSREFLERLEPNTKSIVILEPLPETEESMADCLSTASDPLACAQPAYYQPGTKELRAVWERVGPEYGATVVDIGQLICPDGTCPAVIDGVITHRDAHHITVEFAAAIIDDLDALLRKEGIVLQEGRVGSGA